MIRLGALPGVLLPVLLLFPACDPAKQVAMRNRTMRPVALVFEHHEKDDTLQVQLAPGEERSMFLGFGSWERPSRMMSPDGRCVGLAFENDHHFDAILVSTTTGDMRVRRRYLFHNGLVLLVE